MAEETEETINEQVPGSSPEPVRDSTDSLYSTTDYDEPASEEEEEEESTSADEQDQEEQTAGDETEEKGEEARFDKHPRFQQLIKERNELKKMLEQEQGKKPSEKSADEPEEGSTLQKLMNMSEEELLEMNAEKPKEFLGNMVDAIREQVKHEQTQAQHEQRTMNTYEDYAKDNPDILDMWESGELQAFLDENPAHNPISAHMYMTQEKREQEMREKIEKELADKYEKRQTARNNSRVLSRTPPADYKPDKTPELKDTRKHGGLNSVLASRIEAMRQNRG